MDQFVALNQQFYLNDNFTGNQKSILGAIAASMPLCFISIKEIMRRTGLCRNTVFKHLKILETNKAIKRTKRFGTSSVFEINPVLLITKVAKKMKEVVKTFLDNWEKKNGTMAYQKKVAKDDKPVPTDGSLTRLRELNILTSVLKV